jgi:TolA-binding protein
MQNLREEIRDLQAQIEEYETEKQELERDARQLIEKDSRVARERNEERSNFQTVSLLFEYAYIRTLMSFKFSYVRRLRRKNELSHSTRRRYVHFPFIINIRLNVWNKPFTTQNSKKQPSKNKSKTT